MDLVFDGVAQPPGLALHSLIALVPLAIWAYERYLRKRAASVIWLWAAALIFLVTNGIVLWDQLRVREMVRSGNGLNVTQGVITQSWHIVSRERDWTRSTLSYKTTISEGFDVAGVRFRWNIADSYSSATFSNAGTPPLTFPEGARVEVTWFVDAATQGERRIVRLRMSPASRSAALADPGFAAFIGRFSGALDAGDQATLSALTKFPVNFGGHAVDRDRADTLWTAMAMPGLQACIRSTVPEQLPGGGRQFTCHGVTLVFGGESADAWTLREIRQGN